MSFKHGRLTEVLLAGVDITEYLHTANLDVDTDDAETTTFRKTWKTYIAGQSGAEYSFEGYFDAAMTPTFTGLVGDQPAGLLAVGPAGIGIGSVARIMEVIETKYAETAPVGGVVGFTFDCLIDTVPGFGVFLNALATAVTADGNGTAVDNGAATTAGGVAQLHVTSVSASDSVVVTIEDSATGSSGWATIGTFASKAAIGAERIVINGTIRRYVRAVFDVTGSGVSINLAVALGRN